MNIKKRNRRRIIPGRMPFEEEQPKKGIWNLIKDVMPILTTLLTLFVGFTLGSVTAENKFLTDTRLQNQSYILELRKDAYNNFFSGQVKLRESVRLEAAGSEQEAASLRQEYNLEVKTSRFQVAIFSTRPVIEALVQLWRVNFNYDRPCEGDPQYWQNEARIYQNMRQEVFGNDEEQELDDRTMITLLFGCTLP